MLTHRWEDMTTADFDCIDPDDWIAVIPVAATEQHGPHLPVSVDCILNAGVIDAVLRSMPDDLNVIVTPMFRVGKSNEHSGFAGTLSLSAETLIRLWTETGESIHRAGFRKMIFYNSHGGQRQILDVVIRDLRVRLNVVAVAFNAQAMELRDGLFSDEEVRYGIHGGEIETSMMLYLRPDLVRRTLAKNFTSSAIAIEKDYEVLRVEGSIGIGWASQDLNVAGAIGNAAAGDQERGRVVVEDLAARFVALLRDVSRFSLPIQTVKP